MIDYGLYIAWILWSLLQGLPDNVEHQSCAVQRGFEFCNECTEFNTCEQMRKFVEDTKWLYQQGVLKNMEMIRRDGLAKWLAGQEKSWRCANCGMPHSWWDETCPQCGQAVANFKADVL